MTTKNLNKNAQTRVRRLFSLGIKSWLSAVILLVMASSSAAFAITTISQSYISTTEVPVGSIVSLAKNSTDQINATDSKNSSSILGVVINSGNSLISLTTGPNNQVQVATSGVVQVLVSDINGEVEQGDEITASPISGVGMKATDNSKVVGIAQDSLSSSGGSQETYTDSKGQKHKVTIGEVPVLVNVAYYFKQPSKTLIPAAFQNIANALAGKTVNTAPILVSMGIFLIMLIIVASMIYSMIHSSIISVGRNPMSQAAIYRDLLQMSALVLGVIIVGVALIYVVLTRF